MDDYDACSFSPVSDDVECSAEVMRGEFQTVPGAFYPSLLLRYDLPKKQNTTKITLPWIDNSEESSLRFRLVVSPLSEKYLQGFLLHMHGEGKLQLLQAFRILLSIHGTTRTMS